MPNRIIFFLFLLPIIFYNCEKKTDDENSAPYNLKIELTSPQKLVRSAIEAIFTASAVDEEGDSLRFVWIIEKGNYTDITPDSLKGKKSIIKWKIPDYVGNVEFKLNVFDEKDNKATLIKQFTIEDQAPVLNNFTVSDSVAIINSSISVNLSFSDPDTMDTVTMQAYYNGNLVSSNQNNFNFQVSSVEKIDTLKIVLKDNYNVTSVYKKVIKSYKEVGSIWVTDTGNNKIFKYSASGFVLFELKNFNIPKYAIITQNNPPYLIISDKGNNRLGKIKSTVSGDSVVYPIQIGDPEKLYFDINNNTVWVIANNNNEVKQINSSLNSVLKTISADTIGTIGGFSIYQNGANGSSIWLSSFSKNKIFILSYEKPDSVIKVIKLNNEYQYPSTIVADSDNGFVFACTKYNVLKINANNYNIESYSGFLQPADMDIDTDNNILWVTDTGNNRIAKINYITGQIQYILQNQFGISRPKSICLNYENKFVYFVDENKIWYLDNYGNLIRKISGFNQPNSIKVNSGIYFGKGRYKK